MGKVIITFETSESIGSSLDLSILNCPQSEEADLRYSSSTEA